MQPIKKVKVRPGFLLSLVVIGMLAATYRFSPATLGQTVLECKKNIVSTEENVPTSYHSKGERLSEKLSENNGMQMGGPEKLTEKQAAPFIKAATEAFKAEGMDFPPSGYWVSSTVKRDKDSSYPILVRLVWYPIGVAAGQESKVKDKIYYAAFPNADLDKGTGDIRDLEVQWNYGESIWSRENDR